MSWKDDHWGVASKDEDVNARNFHNVESKWMQELKGTKVKGKVGTWEFDGYLDPSGVWYWSNKKMPYMVAATPYWDGNDLPVQLTGENEYSYLKVLKAPKSPSHYIQLIKPILKALKVSEK